MSNNLIFLLIFRIDLALALKLIMSLRRLILLVRTLILDQIGIILNKKLFMATNLIRVELLVLAGLNIVALVRW